jgi:hypothetical protein
MKKYLTKRNLVILAAVLLVAYLLWPSGKKEQTTGTQPGANDSTVPLAGSGERPENVFNVDDVPEKSVPIGPAMQMKRPAPQQMNETLVSIQAKQATSAIIPLN